MTPKIFGAASDAVQHLGRYLRLHGQKVEAVHWQGVKAPAPMLELYGPSFRCPIADGPKQLASDVKPNLPWADEHFQERVSGVPHNPPPSTARWPHNPSSFEFRENEQYSHTYPERLWPKYAGHGAHREDMEVFSGHRGIRYEYGDLKDVVRLLDRDPLTRQAFVPIWFPEDTGATHGGRVPCTLGYLFMYRSGYLHCTYYIRSCDYFRHLRDDVYLAGRLTQWILDHVGWGVDAKPGYLDMHIASLHCWLNEKNLLPA